MAKSIMIQGTGSNVGKSMLVAGLARAFFNRGISVAPFKPQNMSNNAAVTVDAGEIGRAQALQAQAAKLEPTVDMNPVLLKPESETGAQIIVQGHRFATLDARNYAKTKRQLMPKVLQSFENLAGSVDLVLVEGAGSPAETNLRAGDIANMGFASAAGIPVVLTGDIDRGGVIAQIVGTKAVQSDADNAFIKAFIINKFRGDPKLFDAGLTEITKHTGWPTLGVLPWFEDAGNLPGEDIMDITGSADGHLKIAVPRLNRIANFDDLDPLSSEPDVSLEIVDPGRPLPGNAQLILIPGSKSTIADLAAFRANRWDIDLAAHVRRGGHVLGICAGFQMLGQQISDPEGIEGPASRVDGLGYLNVTTTMSAQKNVTLTDAKFLQTGDVLTGYEIHIGKTSGPDCSNPWITASDRNLSAASSDGRIMGCYLHGLFANDGFRRQFLRTIGGTQSDFQYGLSVDETLDRLATHLERHLDLNKMLTIAGEI